MAARADWLDYLVFFPPSKREHVTYLYTSSTILSSIVLNFKHMRTPSPLSFSELRSLNQVIILPPRSNKGELLSLLTERLWHTITLDHYVSFMPILTTFVCRLDKVLEISYMNMAMPARFDIGCMSGHLFARASIWLFIAYHVFVIPFQLL